MARLTVLVCGSRDWTDADAIRSRLERLGREATIIHGAASRKVLANGEMVERSADMLADRAARDLGLTVHAYPADWDAEPRKAGTLRNLTMLDQEPHMVLAFQRNGSRGTQHTVDEARRRGIPVEVHCA